MKIVAKFWCSSEWQCWCFTYGLQGQCVEIFFFFLVSVVLLLERLIYYVCFRIMKIMDGKTLRQIWHHMFFKWPPEHTAGCVRTSQTKSSWFVGNLAQVKRRVPSTWWSISCTCVQRTPGTCMTESSRYRGSLNLLLILKALILTGTHSPSGFIM